MAWSLETLVRSPWLSHQPAPVAQALLAAGQLHRIEAGESVFAEGEGGLFAVVEGRLSIDAAAAGERRVLIDFIRAGHWLAHTASAGEDTRPVAVRARTAATLFLIPDAKLARIARNRPDIWQSVNDLTRQQLQGAVRMIARLLTASPAELIALRLVMLAEGRPPTVTVSQSELGELTGLTRKAVNAHLALLETAGSIRRAYGRVMLTDLAALKRIVGA